MTWRYLAQRLTGQGPGEFIDADLPLTDVQLTRTLSGPTQIRANVPFSFSRLKAPDNRLLLEEWGTAVYAEQDGIIRHGAILQRARAGESSLELECGGFSGYPTGMPWTADGFYGVEVDPMDMVRKIWDHLQSQGAGDLTMVVDETQSPVRIGKELEQIEFDTQAGPVSFEAGPFKLAWFVDQDLGAKIDTLAKDTPFDYYEEHTWDDRQTSILHRLRLFYPRTGNRRTDLRFVIGENVSVIPDVVFDGDGYASDVMLLGAGEGRDMVRGEAGRPTDRLRRVAVVADKGLRTKVAADEAARRELEFRLGLGEISEVVVRNHVHAPLGSLNIGDEIRLEGDAGWLQVDRWLRVVAESVDPDAPDVMTYTVVPSSM